MQRASRDSVGALAAAAAVAAEPVECQSYAPMGVPLDVRVEQRFAGAVHEALRGWDGEPEPGARRLSIAIAGDDRLCGAGAIRNWVEGDRLFIDGGPANASANAATGDAVCRLSPSLAFDPELLREQILDPLLLFLLTRSGRTPLHASAFIIGDLAVLLAGPSGSGKSCLAVAADRAGFAVLSDDTVHVRTSPDLMIWGVPRPARLYPKDAGCTGALRLRNRKLKQEVRLSSAAAGPARKAVVCRLLPGRAPSLRRMDAAEARSLFEPLEPGFDLLATDIRAAAGALVGKGAWALTLSDDPAEAIRLLAGMASVLGSAP